MGKIAKCLAILLTLCCFLLRPCRRPTGVAAQVIPRRSSAESGVKYTGLCSRKDWNKMLESDSKPIPRSQRHPRSGRVR